MNMNDYKHVTQRMHPSDACKHEILRAAAQNEQPRETRRQIFWKNLPVAAAGMAACLSLIVGGAFIWQNRADFAPRTQSQVPEVSAVTEEVGASLTTTATTLAQVAEVQTETAAQTTEAAQTQAAAESQTTAAQTTMAQSLVMAEVHNPLLETASVRIAAITEAAPSVTTAEAATESTASTTTVTTIAEAITSTTLDTIRVNIRSEEDPTICEDHYAVYVFPSEFSIFVAKISPEEHKEFYRTLGLEMFGYVQDDTHFWKVEEFREFWREYEARTAGYSIDDTFLAVMLRAAYLVATNEMTQEEAEALLDNVVNGGQIPDEFIETMGTSADIHITINNKQELFEKHRMIEEMQRLLGQWKAEKYAEYISTDWMIWFNCEPVFQIID